MSDLVERLRSAAVFYADYPELVSLLNEAADAHENGAAVAKMLYGQLGPSTYQVGAHGPEIV